MPPTRQQVFFFAVASLAVTSIVLAAISSVKITQLALPMPTWLPGLNIAFTGLSLFGLTVAPAVRAYLRQKKIFYSVPSTIARNVSSMAASVILVLSLIYGEPSDIKSCASDSQWQRLFLTKNEIAVRSIQTALRCCGYNSMQDRAWPFPSKEVSVRTCELTQGYYIACGKLWKQEQQLAATLNAIAAALNWVLVMLATIYGPRGEVLQSEIRPRGGPNIRPQDTRHSSEQRGLIESSDGIPGVERYTDDEDVDVSNGSAKPPGPRLDPEAQVYEPRS